MDDIRVYRAEGAAVWHGTDLYGFTVTEWDLPATYPPFAALLFVPVALVPLSVAKGAFVAGNVALLAWLIALSLRAARPARPARTAPSVRPARTDGPDAATGAAGPSGTTPVAAPLPAVVCLTAVALWLEPVFQTVAFGQINLLLACLVLWDVGRPDGARAKGFALGLAAGVKLTPALFAVHLLLTGRLRAACWAAAGFAASVAVGACALPGASVEFWTRRMFETARVGKAWIVDNQSLQGLVARLLHETEPGGLWLAPTLALAAGGMWLARRVTVRHGKGADGGPPEFRGAGVVGASGVPGASGVSGVA
ncbi:glycosyltransferase 87 family protein, partial [Streptomyces sp. PU-14G]|uniref:glycosyltransferase 87 family protein n=1 Tax=Streptomyces sp. PU-14G TaxID=2800808 RepID=UPI0034DE8E3D